MRSGLATLYPNTNAIFSPDNKYVVTGAGATTKGGKGHLLFMRKDTLETVKDLEVDTTPVKVFWHSKINQVCSCWPSLIRFPRLIENVDCHGFVEWAHMRPVFTGYVA